MKKIKRKLTATFKTQVVIESLQERQTLSELGLHPNQISQWRRDFLEKAEQVFSTPDNSRERELEAERACLFQQIGDRSADAITI
jgi:transposase